MAECWVAEWLSGWVAGWLSGCALSGWVRGGLVALRRLCKIWHNSKRESGKSYHLGPLVLCKKPNNMQKGEKPKSPHNRLIFSGSQFYC